MTTTVSRRVVTGTAVALLLAAAPPARAQGSGEGFLFHQPSGSFVLRLGMEQPRAGSDIFTFVTDELTLGKSDFRGFDIAGELNATVGPRTTVVFGAGWAGSKRGSEYRNYVDNNNLPIEQTTSFERVPLTIGLRYYLIPQGQAVGRLAWVPSKYAPYVGAGLGAMWYQFRQSGDFIDMGTMNVFSDTYKTSDWALTAHVNAGLDVSLGPRLYATAEGRYSWGRASIGPDFSGFNKIDLNGFALTLGVGFRM